MGHLRTAFIGMLVVLGAVSCTPAAPQTNDLAASTSVRDPASEVITQSKGPFTCPDCELVQVTGIVDGDTIDTSIGRVRFYGIDTPERGESCYQEATDFTALLVGDQVRLEDGPRLTDGFDRRLAYVFDIAGSSIDAQIVKAGLGIAWIRDGQHRGRLIDLQSVATSAARGCLWRNSDAK